MTGVFVPFDDPPKRKTSSLVGWIEDGSGCHIWCGSRNSNGYAKVAVSRRSVFVHRLRYEREIGPIPSGLELDHYVCNNGAGGCCNPLHCRPVTHRENMLRSESIGATNLARTHCPRGHALEPGNLLSWHLKHGSRKCRACHNAQQNERNRRTRQMQTQEA